jgi:TPR repeat protein
MANGVLVQDQKRGEFYAQLTPSHVPAKRFDDDTAIPTEDVRLKNRNGWVFASLGLGAGPGSPGIAFADSSGNVRVTWFQRESAENWWDIAVWDTAGEMRLSLQLRPGQSPNLVVYPDDQCDSIRIGFRLAQAYAKGRSPPERARVAPFYANSPARSAAARGQSWARTMGGLGKLMDLSRHIRSSAFATCLLTIALGCAGCQKPSQSSAENRSLVRDRLKADETQFRGVCDPEHVSLPKERYAEEWQKLLDACEVAARPMANRGNSAAQYFIGEKFASDEKYEAAIPWLEKAATQGHTRAMNRLGYIYSTSTLNQDKGFKSNELVDGKKAVRWYRQSAEMGDARAMVELGSIYLDGVFVTTDYTEAIRWYERAAEAGDDNVSSATLMGLYNSDRLGAADRMNAYKWASINCADFGRAHGIRNDISCGLRDNLEEKMSREEISKAQQLASAWEKQFRKP